jgi:hypothetical protein
MNATLKRSLLGMVVLTTSAAGAAAPKSPRAEPLAAAEALASFQLDPGLRIELVAIEPLVVGPVAMAFDEGASRCSKTRTATGASTNAPTSRPG